MPLTHMNALIFFLMFLLQTGHCLTALEHLMHVQRWPHGSNTTAALAS